MRSTTPRLQSGHKYWVSTSSQNDKQGIHGHQTPSWYRNSASHAAPYGTLAAKCDVIHKTGSTQHITTPQEEDRHGHRRSAQKSPRRLAQQFQRYARGQTEYFEISRLVCTSIPHISPRWNWKKRRLRIGGHALVSGCPEHWTIQP